MDSTGTGGQQLGRATTAYAQQPACRYQPAGPTCSLTLCALCWLCRSGIIECPATADVQMLKRLFQYQAHNKLLPALQVRALLTMSTSWSPHV